MLAVPTTSTSQSLGRRSSKPEARLIGSKNVGRKSVDLDPSHSLSHLPVSSTSLFVPSFDTPFIFDSNQMFPAPIFLAPIQAIMPPDFNPSNYDGSNPYPAPEMFPCYPNMQLLMPIPTAGAAPIVHNEESPQQITDPNCSGHTSASAQDTAVSTPFEPPQYGPGPPIVTGERLKGPRGCNLFVFHLPNEITNWDLYLLFRRYGTILSVHIMVNKTTGLSKGYGFVSFAFRNDAKSAIEAMDGFRLGKKRLKVQLKRLQDDNSDDPREEENANELQVSRVASYSSKCSSNSNTLPSSPRHTHGDISEELAEKLAINSPIKSPEHLKR